MTNQGTTQLRGSIKEISAGADGSVWALSTTVNGTATSGATNHTIHRWNESRQDWDNIPGQANKIAVAPDGTPWIVTAQGGIWRWNKSASSFEQMPGGASQISIGGDGSVYVIGGLPVKTGYYNNAIYKWNGTSWSPTGGTSMWAAAEPLGSAWVVSATGVVYRWFDDPRLSWQTLPDATRVSSITISHSGHVWAVSPLDLSGGNGYTFQWNGKAWVQTTAQAARIAVEPNGRPWFVFGTGVVYRGVPQDVPVQNFGKVTPPPPAPVVPPSQNSSDDICWKNTTTRGVGKVPGYCPQGTIEDPTGAFCYPQCRAGYNGVGPVCWNFPASYGRGWGQIKDGCGIGKEYDAGLCYPTCPANSSGVGPVCWGTCGGKYPVNCGAACAGSDLLCGQAIVNQITSVVESAVAIFGMVVSAGGTAAATSAFKAAAKSAGSAGVKAATKAAMKAYLIQQAKDMGRSLLEGEAESLAVTAVDNYAKGMVGGELGFDPESLDPTGIAGIVQAFNKPICDPQVLGTVAPANPLLTINTTVFGLHTGRTNVSDLQLYANSGWVWYKVKGASDTTHVSAAADGTVWRLDQAGKAWAWNGDGWTQFGNQSFKDIATGGGKQAWAIGNTDGSAYKFNGKDWTRTPSGGLVGVKVGADGTALVQGANKVFKWLADPGVWSEIFNQGSGVRVDMGVINYNKILLLSAEGALMESTGGTSAGSISTGIGNSPTAIQSIANGGSGEVWFLKDSKPNRIVKWTPGVMPLGPTIETSVFDLNTFKEIAVF